MLAHVELFTILYNRYIKKVSQIEFNKILPHRSTSCICDIVQFEEKKPIPNEKKILKFKRQPCLLEFCIILSYDK